MKEFKVNRSSTFEDYYFTELEFIQWYNKSPVYGLEPYTEMMNNIKSPKYGNGYYIGMGYNVTYSPEQNKSNSIQSVNTGCYHKNKYLNKITTALQFWVCPDCKQEVSEHNYNPDKNWWIGV